MDPLSGQWLEHFLPGKPIIVTTTKDSGLRYVYVIGCTSRLPLKLRGLNCGSSNDLNATIAIVDERRYRLARLELPAYMCPIRVVECILRL